MIVLYIDVCKDQVSFRDVISLDIRVFYKQDVGTVDRVAYAGGIVSLQHRPAVLREY